jgi:hypothetical protein
MNMPEGPFLKRKRTLITKKKCFIYIYSKLPDHRSVSHMTIPKNSLYSARSLYSTIM